MGRLKLGLPPAPKLDIVRFELSSGAKLFVSPRPGAPVTAAQVHLRGGHSLDTPELGGVAWLTGRLVDQGTRHQTAEEGFPALGRRVAAFKASRKQVHLILGHLGVKINDPDYAALVVMDHVLGTGPGFTNRISRRLRDEDGRTYTVNAAIYNSAGNLPGTFTAYIGTSPEHTRRALAGFVEEMRRMQDERVGAAELDVAKNYLTGSFGLGFERASRRASFLVSQYRFHLPDDHLESLPRRFQAVTAADVQAAAQRHLFPDACCLSAGGPLSKKDLKSALAAATE